MNALKKIGSECADELYEIGPARGCARARAGRTIRVYGFVAAILLATTSLVRADMPLVYRECASVEADPASVISACSAIIKSGRTSSHNLAVALTNRGVAWAKQDQTDRAISDLNRAISLDRNYGRAFTVRGLVHVKKNNLNQALADLNQAVRLNPEAVQPYNNRAIVYRKKHQSARALADLNRAIAINSGYAAAYFNRALVWYDQGEIDRAIADFTQGLKFDPRNAKAHAQRGGLYERKGNRRQALAGFRAALDIDPTQAMALAGRARLAVLPPASDPPPASDDRRPKEPARSPKPAASSSATTGSLTEARSPGRPVPHSAATAEAVNQGPVPAPRPPLPGAAKAFPAEQNVPLPAPRPAAARSLPEALAACSKIGTSFKAVIESPDGKGNLVLPASYHGRKHLDCVITAIVDEATAIDREYGEIVRANYPDLHDAKSICRIESEQLQDHIVRVKAFDTRAAMLQKTYAANAGLIADLREAVRNINLSSQTDSAALTTSISGEISGLIEQAAARQADVVRLMQRIEGSKKAMATVGNIRNAICE